MPIKLCFFIDGLDEYGGLESDIAEVFENIVMSPYVKLCVSSRPHVEFEDAFNTRPTIQLQDLTRSDIQQYVEDLMGQDKRIHRLAVTERAQWDKFKEEISRAAQGVFLWVMLVVTSLLNGLAKHDKIADLQRILRALPEKLDDLYQQMILKVEGFYQQEASQLYQLIEASTTQPDEYKPVDLLSVLSLYLAMQEDVPLRLGIAQRELCC